MRSSRHKCADPEPLKFVTIPSTSDHTATVILFHGLGGTVEGGIMSATETLRKGRSLSHVKWILPHAPVRPLTGNGGREVPAWFDVYSFDIANRREDAQGIASAAKSVEALITTEIESGIASERIILAGISQGAALAIWTGLTTQLKVGGVAILSGYVPLRKTIKNDMSPHAASIPLFWGHGMLDIQVFHDFSQSCAATLASELGIPFRLQPVKHQMGVKGLDFHSYEGLQHWFNNAELADLKLWIKGVVPSESSPKLALLRMTTEASKAICTEIDN